MAKAGHNVKRDWLRLRTAGVELQGIQYDSMLASFLLDPGKRSHALSALCVEHLGLTIPAYDQIVGKGKSKRTVAEIPARKAEE